MQSGVISGPLPRDAPDEGGNQMQSGVISGTHPRFESLTICRLGACARGFVLPRRFLFGLSHHLLHLLLLALLHRLVELRRTPLQGPRTGGIALGTDTCKPLSPT